MTAAEALYGPHALPYGVFSPADGPRRLGARLGDSVVDLPALSRATGGPAAEALAAPSLDGLLAEGRHVWRDVRAWLQDRVADGSAAEHATPLPDVRLHLPFTVADYVDFYSSLHHATNVGRIFRPDGEPLTPNWRHLPIGYHGRSGTVVVSGTDVTRPCGQRRAPGAELPSYGPSERLDFEVEVGFVVGVPSPLGRPVATSGFPDHVLGVTLVNDWSARDLQAWEYVPLGPFLGKAFATSVSAWVLPLEALEQARVMPPVQDPPVLPHLRDVEPWGLDLRLEVAVNGHVVSTPPFAGMYWTASQQLAHLTSCGASLRTGDLYASGTVSGPRREERGSLLELSWAGAEPVAVGDGTRTFLEDGDVVTITGWAPGPGGSRVGLGEVSGRVLPPLRSTPARPGAAGG